MTKISIRGTELLVNSYDNVSLQGLSLYLRLGVKNPTVYRYETDRIPDGDTLLRIAALDSKRRGVEWILTGMKSPLERGDLGGTGIVADPADIYGKGLDRKDWLILKEVEDLLKEADDDIKKHLRNQVDLLRRAAKTPKKRASAED